jgi:hypothetical protein
MDNKLETRSKRQGKREEGREKKGQDEERNEIRETVGRFSFSRKDREIQVYRKREVKLCAVGNSAERSQKRQISRIKNLKYWKIGLNVKT